MMKLTARDAKAEKRSELKVTIRNLTLINLTQIYQSLDRWAKDLMVIRGTDCPGRIFEEDNFLDYAFQ